MKSAITGRRRACASGPILVSGANPLPILIFFALSMKRDMKRSNTFAWMKSRLGETQTCPALENLSVESMSAARSTSVSSQTITGE